MFTDIKMTVRCHICDEIIPGEVDGLTRTDILMGHLVTKHGSQFRPATPLEGPPLPRALGIHWPWRK